jgi:hypothetical protein
MSMEQPNSISSSSSNAPPFPVLISPQIVERGRSDSSDSKQVFTIDSIPTPPLLASPWIYSSPVVGRISTPNTSFDDRNFLLNHAGNSRIKELLVYCSSNDSIQAIQCVYNIYHIQLRQQVEVRGVIHGNIEELHPQILLLADNEYLTQIYGSRSDVIKSITVATNLGKLKTFGFDKNFNNSTADDEELQFNCVIPEENRVIGFHGGFCEKAIENIGVLYSTSNYSVAR